MFSQYSYRLISLILDILYRYPTYLSYYSRYFTIWFYYTEGEVVYRVNFKQCSERLTSYTSFSVLFHFVTFSQVSTIFTLSVWKRLPKWWKACPPRWKITWCNKPRSHFGWENVHLTTASRRKAWTRQVTINEDRVSCITWVLIRMERIFDCKPFPPMFKTFPPVFTCFLI